MKTLFPLSSSMYSWIAQCREPSIVFEILRLIVMMNESKKEYEGIMNPNEYNEFIMNSFDFYYDKLD